MASHKKDRPPDLSERPVCLFVRSLLATPLGGAQDDDGRSAQLPEQPRERGMRHGLAKAGAVALRRRNGRSSKEKAPDNGAEGRAGHARHETQLKPFSDPDESNRERDEHCVPLLRPTADQ
jgi:hypothetical protein